MPPGVAGRRTAPTSFPEYQTFYPTMEEFSDFMGYINKIETEHKANEAGICKIVPPKEWIPRKAGYNLDDMDYTIQGPIRQSFRNFGDRGCFQTKGIIQHQMSVHEYKKMADSERYRPPPNAQTPDDLEKHYWKSLAYCPPVYGCDVSHAITDEDQTVWNIAKLDSILTTVAEDLGEKIQGVNTPYLYFGMWKATFSWHVEDMDLYAINMVHYGAPKTWYCVPPEHGHILEKTCKELFPHVAQSCNNFMRHKTCLIQPKILEKYGVPFNKLVQGERDIIVVFPYAYHSGFNHGFNIAESTNFALPQWVEFGKRANPCTCERARVKFSMDPFVKKFQPEKYELWKKGLDIAPHPYDPPEKRAEVLKWAANPEEYRRQQEEKQNEKLKKEEEKVLKKIAAQKKLKEKAKERKEREKAEKNEKEEGNLQSPADQEECILIHVYRVNGFDRIKVEVNADTKEILNGKSALEEYCGEHHAGMYDFNNDSTLIKSMLKDDGILYFDSGKVIKKRSEEDMNQLTENKTVAMYKHVGEEGLHITVDPDTKELTSKPSEKILDLLKETGPGTLIKDLIEIGVFVKVCDCDMEFEIAEKSSTPPHNLVETSEDPVAKKPKIETKIESEQTTKLTASPATPAQSRGMQVEIYRHRITGEHFTISAQNKKLMGRANEKTKDLFGSKSAKDLIEDGTLQLMGTRHNKPKFHHGVFRMAVDDKNRKIEIASQDEVTVFTFEIDQEVMDVLLEGEENFIRMEDKSCEDFQTSPNILRELLSIKPENDDLKNQVHSAFADSTAGSSNPDFNYDRSQHSLLVKDTIKGRFYLRKIQFMPPTLFHSNDTATDALIPMEEEEAEEEEEVQILTKPKPEPEVKEEDTEDDDDLFDDDSDDDMMYTSDSISESNDEGSDDPGYYGGSIREWKSSSSSKRNKRKNVTNERRLAEERRAIRRAERTERRERKVAKATKRQKRVTEEVPAMIEMTQKLLSLDYQAEQKFDLQALEQDVHADDPNSRGRLSSVLTIFRGFRIVKREKGAHDKYIWMGKDEEEIERVLKSILESSNTDVQNQDPLWNICSEILRALMTARKSTRVFLPIINESFSVNESRRLTMSAAILEGLGMVEKITDELGGFVFNGTSKPYEDFKKTLWDMYSTEFSLKELQMNLTEVEVKEEHRYPIKAPEFDFRKALKRKDIVIPEVPEELKDDKDIQRAIVNYEKVCKCGSMKDWKGPLNKSKGAKRTMERKKVLVGGKRKLRCKKCTGCLAQNCKKCKFCTQPHLKKPCINRVCLFPVVPNCPCFI